MELFGHFSKLLRDPGMYGELNGMTGVLNRLYEWQTPTLIEGISSYFRTLCFHASPGHSGISGGRKPTCGRLTC